MRDDYDPRAVAFSNGTAGYGWMANWCDRCQRDAIFRNTGKGSGCPILCSVLTENRVPPEWLINDGVLQDYTCIEFRAPGSGNPEPRPKPAPQSGDGLFPPLERGSRMLLPMAEPKPAEVSS